MDDQAALRQLLDERAIHEVAMRYTFAIDERDWDGVAAVFRPDAWIDYQDLPPGTRDDFLPRLRAAIEQFSATQHLLTGQLVTWDGPVAQVRSYAIAYHRFRSGEGLVDLVAGVHYADRFERVDGRWLITRRTVVTPWLRHDAVASGEPMVPEGI